MLKLVARPQPSGFWRIASPLLALVITVVLGVLLFMALGKDPVRGLQVFFWEPIRSGYALGELVVKAAGGALPRTSVVCSSVDALPVATAATTSTAASAAVPVKAWDALLAAMPADRRQITLGPHKLAVSTYLAGFALVVSALLRLLALAVTKAVRLVRPA